MGTVLYGSTLILICLDYFIENFKLIHWFGDKLRDGQSYESISVTSTTNLCTISWILLAIWPINCLIGLFTQCLITSIGINYSNDYNYGIVRSATTSRSSAQTTANRLKREEQKLEQRQKKYRYLYQVRTAHGDVISQVYQSELYNLDINKIL